MKKNKKTRNSSRQKKKKISCQEKFSKGKIKIIGIGGSGGNSLSRFYPYRMPGIELVAVNADLQDLKKTKADFKIQIGRKLTNGLGAGMNPKIGERAALESKEEIKSRLLGGDIVFIVCGLGGGTGSGAAPIITETAKEIGALTIAVATLPFEFEGFFRRRIAAKALEKVKEKADTVFTVSNEKILSQCDDKIKLSSAFLTADEILRQAVLGIAELMIVPGIVSVDFADIKSIMRDSGLAAFGIGIGEGEQKVKKAALFAIKSSLVDFSSKKPSGILFNISGGKNLTLANVQEAAEIITKNSSPGAKIIFGAIQDDKIFKPDEIKITFIATGIESKEIF